MQTASRRLLALTLLLSLTGCYRQSIRAIDDDGAPLTDRGGERDSDTSVGLFYGLVPGKTKVECPYGIARVDTGMPWYSIFAIYFTAGLVVPLKATYTCNAAPETETEPAEQPAELPNGGW
jgi:hypothetical protein